MASYGGRCLLRWVIIAASLSLLATAGHLMHETPATPDRAHVLTVTSDGSGSVVNADPTHKDWGATSSCARLSATVVLQRGALALFILGPVLLAGKTAWLTSYARLTIVRGPPGDLIGRDLLSRACLLRC